MRACSGSLDHPSTTPHQFHAPSLHLHTHTQTHKRTHTHTHILSTRLFYFRYCIRLFRFFLYSTFFFMCPTLLYSRIAPIHWPLPPLIRTPRSPNCFVFFSFFFKKKERKKNRVPRSFFFFFFRMACAMGLVSTVSPPPVSTFSLFPQLPTLVVLHRPTFY
ncbi:hypothetical protein BC940DRAFT_116415 [Gongronella butleri]|nr:hypothetical protein BC940DRAFT_116415 [Gongronella butleri]